MQLPGPDTLMALWMDSPLPFPELLDRGEKYFLHSMLFVSPL